ncbi:malonic semialdehyde reductase [Novosphingobium sp. AP12]|uniref:malonic semialdehyde reductase n=1 Tax=Novosphingobium sp. AP12 TaxID=1144305 RepID=UPI000271F625|nr:malonic semialdehyde reductase [Novosphingobium sp. AP12]EJL28898.1 nitroreductase [Novosphingobium sp. AP12]
MTTTLAPDALDQIFGQARSNHRFDDRAVDDATLRDLYELTKLAPTGFNAQPARYVFVRSAEAKARLAPALSSSNREKTLAAPLNAIVAWDSRFFEHLPDLLPGRDVAAYFVEDERIRAAGTFNAALQAAFLIVAARSLGLDVGPMTGFNAEALDAAFFPDGRLRSLLVLNLGYGDRSELRGRGPRLAFEDAVSVL